MKPTQTPDQQQVVRGFQFSPIPRFQKYHPSIKFSAALSPTGHGRGLIGLEINFRQRLLQNGKEGENSRTRDTTRCPSPAACRRSSGWL